MARSASSRVPAGIRPAVSGTVRSLRTGALFGVLAIALTAMAQEASVPYDRIEEDWEIVVSEPDSPAGRAFARAAEQAAAQISIASYHRGAIPLTLVR